MGPSKREHSPSDYFDADRAQTVPFMSQDYFEQLPPELILLHSPLLSIASLNALALTCRRLHEIIQPELDRHITPELGQALLLWAAASRPHIVLKLLSAPYCIHPSPPPPDG